MKQWLRKLLGTDSLEAEFVSLRWQVTTLQGKISSLEEQNASMRRQLDVVAPGIGRIIARIEPLYAQDELDPQRRRESDEIAERVLKRLFTESEIRRRQTP